MFGIKKLEKLINGDIKARIEDRGKQKEVNDKLFKLIINEKDDRVFRIFNDIRDILKLQDVQIKRLEDKVFAKELKAFSKDRKTDKSKCTTTDKPKSSTKKTVKTNNKTKK